MRFELLDEILHIDDTRIVAVKQVSLAEEYLGDHFPGFPVLPGVLMIETMVQAARRLLARSGHPRMVLGQVRALKYGAMVRPGERLVVEVTLADRKPGADDGIFRFRGTGTVHRTVRPAVRPAVGAVATPGQLKSDSDAAETAVSGRFIMRPIRIAQACGIGTPGSC